MQRHLVLVTMILLGIAAAGVFCHRVRNPLPPPSSEEVALPPVPGDAWVADVADGGGIIGRPMPSEPMKGQKRPPCAEDEATLNGACWLELARAPGPDNCGPRRFLKNGKCYAPVQQAPAVPTSYGE